MPLSHNKISILTCIVYVISIFIGARKYSLSDNRKLKQQPRKRFFQIFLKILVNNGYENHTHLTVSGNVGGYINSRVDGGKYFLINLLIRAFTVTKQQYYKWCFVFFFRKVSINILMTKDKTAPGGEVFFLQHLDLEH